MEYSHGGLNNYLVVAIVILKSKQEERSRYDAGSAFISRL